MNKEFENKIQNAIHDSYGVQTSASFTTLFEANLKNLRSWKRNTKKEEGLIDVIDFFSGCGGMSLGFAALSQKNNIFDLRGGVDINESALKSYSKNFNSPTIKNDIRELCSPEGVELIKDRFEIGKSNKPLVIIGCAPCQGFTAHRKKNWHREDERNTLVGTFADLASRFDPDFIIMENVPEILGKKYWSHYQEARDVLSKKGYKIKQPIYNSAAVGVPQARNRAIVIASKSDFSLPLPVLQPEEYKTVREAIGKLPKVEAGEICQMDKYHRSAKHKKTTIDTISQVPKDGGSRPAGVGPKCLDKVKGFYDVYGRLAWDKPSITLTQYSRNPASGRYTHPEQNRGLTIREAARLQSFPDNFYFHGPLDSCFKQIGEAVPPALAVAIATQVLLEISKLKIKNIGVVESVNKPVSSSYSSEYSSIKSKELIA
jgi:DNA (cytosine-5)-methyltransferase 1